MLVGMQNVAAVPENEVSDGRDFAFGIRAGLTSRMAEFFMECVGAGTPDRAVILPLQGRSSARDQAYMR